MEDQTVTEAPPQPAGEPPVELELSLPLEWNDDDVVQNQLETIAEHFLKKPRDRINHKIQLIVQVPGPMRENTASHILQHRMTRWIREHASRSGAGEDILFLSMPGVPVRLRVDIARGLISPILTFRAISR